MKKRWLISMCTIMTCALLTGCNTAKEEQSNTVESVTESVEDATESVETSTENVESVTEVVEENTETAGIISPLPTTIDMNHLENCTVAVSLEQGGAYVDDTGAMQMDVTVYTYDLYDMVDMASLKVGDVIEIRGQEVAVDSLEQDARGIIINGGIEEGGYDFRADDGTVWYECGFNDAKSYYELGKATIRVSADMTFYDNSDLDKGEVTYFAGDFLTDAAGIVYHFVPNNTSIVIENGMIIEMHRSYMP